LFYERYERYIEILILWSLLNEMVWYLQLEWIAIIYCQISNKSICICIYCWFDCSLGSV